MLEVQLEASDAVMTGNTYQRSRSLEGFSSLHTHGRRAPLDQITPVQYEDVFP